MWRPAGSATTQWRALPAGDLMNAVVDFLSARLERYLAELRDLAAIDSGSDDQAGVNAVQDWLQRRLISLGADVTRYPDDRYGDHLAATLRGRGDGRIVLLGHSDTVYPRGTGAQRPLTIHGNTVRGPGTCDMKAGLLSGLYALEALQATGSDCFAEILFLSVSDEETGARTSPPLIRTLCAGAAAVLTLEAARANGDIVTARKAIAWYTVTARGHSAHAGVEPEKGRNAIVALAELVPALNALNGIRPGVTVNAGVIQGGSRPSVVPNLATLQLDLRAWTTDDMAAAAAALVDCVAAARAGGVTFELALQPGSTAPPLEYTPGVQRLEAMTQEVATELGFHVDGARTGGSSDICFAAETGTPGLDGLGPVGGLDHGPDEYIELNSIVPRTALLAGLIMEIADKRRGV